MLLPVALGGVALGTLAVDPARAGADPRLIGLAIIGAAAGSLAIARGWGTGIGGALLLALVAVASVGLGGARAVDAQLARGPDSVGGLTGRAWEISGTLLDDPRPRGDRQQAVLGSVVARAADDRGEVTGLNGVPGASGATTASVLHGRLLAWLPRAIDASAGDRVTFVATVEEPVDFDGFAYRAYLARQGVGGIARTYQANVEHGVEGPLATIAATRRALRDGLDAIVPEPEAALGAGILLGARASISPDIQDAFAVAGLTHIVAISGWNIAIVIGLIARALDRVRRRRGGRWIVPAATAAAIASYVLLVGASPSVVRAALMAGALLVGRLAGSRGHAASALMLAALIMLIAAPAVLWDVGFQLSLLATAGLIAFAAPMEAVVARVTPLPGWLREPVALTLSAQLTTLPVILSSFERLSLVAPLANVLVVPVVPFVMLGCAIAAPLGALDAAVHVPLLGDLVTWLAGGTAWLGLRTMIVAGATAAAIPGASLPLAAPPWLALAWYPGLALVAARVRTLGARRGREPGPVTLVAAPQRAANRPTPAQALGAAATVLRLVTRPAGALLALVATLAAITLLTLPDGRLHVHVLDIGQGDAILVTAPNGATLLVDGGPDPDLTLRRLGEVRPWWRHDLTVVLLTHPHEDHVAGLPEVLRRYRVRFILDAGRAYPNATYARFLTLAAAEAGGSVVAARAGMSLGLDDRLRIDLLYPSADDLARPLPPGDINSASVVALLRFDRFTALLTGDAEAPVEQLLADRNLLGPVDVLKVGHQISTEV
jgi:competence protein ComEC